MATDLLSKLLIYSPKARFTPLEALTHSFFEELRMKVCKIHTKLDLFNFTIGFIKYIF